MAERHVHKTKCTSNVVTINDKIVKQATEHNHILDAAQVGAAKIVVEIKKRATCSRDAPHALISDVLTNCPKSVASKLPLMGTIKRNIRLMRQQNCAGPALPLNRSEIIVPYDFSRTFNGDSLLMFDSGPIDNRIMIFSTKRHLQCLAHE